MLTVNQAFKQILKTKAGYCSLPREGTGCWHNHTFCLLETREGTGCTITRSVYLKPEKVRVAQSHVLFTCTPRYTAAKFYQKDHRQDCGLTSEMVLVHVAKHNHIKIYCWS